LSERQRERLLEQVADPPEELGAVGAVEDAVVAGKRHAHQLARDDRPARFIDGRLCRQFEVDGGKAASAGVACRSGRTWRLEGWSAGVPAASGQADGGYITAAGPSNAAVEAVTDRLGVAETLDRTAEARAIGRDWTR